MATVPAIGTHHLALLVSIEECGSLHAAARQLHLTPSALSQQLKDLETRLGAPLFKRQWRRLAATEAARRLTAAARPLLAELARVEAETRRLLDGSMGTIRVATACHQSYRWLGAVLTEFASRWPNVDVTIVPEATTAPLLWLSERKLDVALVASEAKHGPHVRLAPLFRDEMVVLVGRRHAWYGRKRIELTAFRDQHLWADADALRRGTLLSAAFEAAGGVRPAKVTVAPIDGALPLEMARANLGVSILPRWSIEPALADGALHAVSLGAKGLWLSWSVATRAEPSEASLASFVDVLRARHPRATRATLRRARPAHPAG